MGTCEIRFTRQRGTFTPVNAAGEDTGRGGSEQGPPDAPRGLVDLGSYVLEVGSAGGTLVERRGGPAPGDLRQLERALEEGESEDRKEEGAAAAAVGVVDNASAVTSKVERAVGLGKGVAEGKALSPEQLEVEVGTLLDLLERLDREKRFKEVLRLARALVNLLTLLRRWVALLQALRAALRAGKELGDLSAVAWARHELGTLRIAAGDVEGAERCLREAQQIRERIGDRRGLAATNRNLHVLCERLREMLREEELVRARQRPPVLQLLAMAAVSVLLFGAGVAAGVITTDSNDATDPPALSGGGGKQNPADNGGEPNGSGGSPETFPLVVTIEGDGGGTVEGEGIACPETCEGDFPAEATVTLAADPGDDSFFEEFSGDCSGESCTVTMDEARSVTATFSITEPSGTEEGGEGTTGAALPEEKEESAVSTTPTETVE